VKPEHAVALQHTAEALLGPQPPMEKLAAVCRLLQALPHYTGVYLYALEGDMLVLRAFHGRATEHTRIPSGKGICGASVLTGAPVRVADVGGDPRYLACNLETKSEIVFPIVRGASYLAQIDVDSDDRAAFGAEDEEFLARVARLLEPLF
jgi:GAF domain-containing protein